MSLSLLLGTHIHPATGESARRQTRAIAALRELCSLPPINLQFADRINLQEFPGFDTQAVLREDSNSITGHPGVRKPVVSELFTRLAEAAVARGVRYFGFTNSDIVFTPAALDRVREADRMAYLFSREDFEPVTEQKVQTLIYGTDAFVVDAAWWLANCMRFRPYVVGESCWDNVYTSQLLCWTDAQLLNREPLVRHEVHDIAWKQSPFAQHNHYLAALDRIYFTRWAMYAARLEELRRDAHGLAEEADELRLQDEIFRDWKPTLITHFVQSLRVVKLKARLWATDQKRRVACRS